MRRTYCKNFQARQLFLLSGLCGEFKRHAQGNLGQQAWAASLTLALSAKNYRPGTSSCSCLAWPNLRMDIMDGKTDSQKAGRACTKGIAMA